MGINVRAVGDLKEGDMVARIPKVACLTIRNAAAAAEPEAAEALENEEFNWAGGGSDVREEPRERSR
ncbi:hypothetical protein ACFX12_014815 [Malus domestica]